MALGTFYRRVILNYSNVVIADRLAVLIDKRQRTISDACSKSKVVALRKQSLKVSRLSVNWYSEGQVSRRGNAFAVLRTASVRAMRARSVESRRCF